MIGKQDWKLERNLFLSAQSQKDLFGTRFKVNSNNISVWVSFMGVNFVRRGKTKKLKSRHESEVSKRGRTASEFLHKVEQTNFGIKAMPQRRQFQRLMNFSLRHLICVMLIVLELHLRAHSCAQTDRETVTSGAWKTSVLPWSHFV